MAAVTLDQIPAYLKQRAGFWAKITGKSADELLMGHQFEILLLESMLDKLGGASGLPQPLPNPSSSSSSISSDQVVVLVELNTVLVNANTPFGNFTPNFNGMASVFYGLSNGGILSMTVKNINGSVNTTGPLQDDNQIGANYWQGINGLVIRSGVAYSFQSDTAGVATILVLGSPKIA